MAKKTAAKKPRRRLKRTARRSLAAVLMITAVVVAAIPVPENVAAPEGGIAVYADENNAEPDAYKYPVDEMETKKLCADTNLGKTDDDTEYKAYIVTELSDGKYQMAWQFKFYQTTVEEDLKGIIYKYNSTYQQDEVTLDPNVIYKYDVIPTDTVTDYFEDNKDSEYKCDKPNPEHEADQFLDEYFKTAYEEYVKAYNEWKTKHDAWENTPITSTPGPEPEKPEVLVKKVGQLSDDDRLKYYCDMNVSPNQKSNNSLKGCKLAEVIDSSQSDNGGNVRVYIPRKLEGQNISYDRFDKYGLRYISDTSIIGIGNNAFKDTENVDKLHVPKEIKYVGVSAFEHSFLKEIDFVNVGSIGDRAFKNCQQLTRISFGSSPSMKKIGVEAFYGADLKEVVFPSTIEEIGPGAFAYCESIKKLDFSNIVARPAVIDEYAFYNTRALDEANFMKAGSTTETVNIDTIGDGAFAVVNGETGNLIEFKFPSKISAEMKDDTKTGLGDCVLAGRTKLKRVIMPADFGRDGKAKIPDNTLYNCYNLECLEFPDDGSGSCGLATYDSGTKVVTNSEGVEEKQRTATGLFRSIRTEDFYVQGPEIDRSSSQATPRKTTWDAATAVSYVVPYLYIKNKLEYWEISDGDYLMCVNDKGVLTSCTRKDTSKEKKNIDLLIPAKVGKKDVTGIDRTCFSDEKLNNNVRSLKIADDGQITTIDPSVFKGWEKLTKVYIGNSIAQIGASAFEGCGNLVDVTFSSPKTGLTFGENAFKTGSGELTFHGDIVKGYAPFDYAMNADNIIEQKDGIRICYKSLSPSFLTVMYDASNGLVTLLDYPKLSQVSTLLNKAYEDEIKAGRYASYEEMRQEKSYDEYSGGTFGDRREEFKTAWMEADTRDEKEALYKNTEIYGPWINRDFCNEVNSGGSGAAGGDDIESDDTASAAIMDFLFEPIVAYAADTLTLKPYYEIYPFKLGSVDTVYPQLYDEEIELLDHVRNIVVPDGVDSIDVYGYYNNSEKNKNNAALYLEGKQASDDRLVPKDPLDTDVWRMYTSKYRQDSEGTTKTQPGLFSGYYDEKLGADKGEKFERGNDQITSITLNSVQYLPDYAFDSCENLLEVDLGPACKDIGIAPFRGCYEMERVGDNAYYTTVNGIIYSNNEDGSLTIEECLPARGRKSVVGPGIVSSSDADKSIQNVSVIKPGAFEDCNNLTAVELGKNGTAGLTVIPENCFKNCNTLQNVILPVTVNDIGQGAFVGASNLRDLTIYGDEVKISGTAFSKDKVWTTVRAYEDSAVVRYVKEYGGEDAYKLHYDAEHPLGRTWQVSFYDANYKLIENMTDDLGNPLDNPQYVTDGDKAVIPNPPILEGWDFEDWVGLDNVDYKLPIRQDAIFYAQGHYEGGAPVDGCYVVEFYDGVTGEQLAGRGSNPNDGKYYVPVGKSFADMGWPEPKHAVGIEAGYEPMGFSSGDSGITGQWTAQAVVNSNLSIIALYKVVITSGGSTNISGGTTNTSGGATNTSGGSTSSKSSSSTSTTSSSTSSSSTSTTSTTSEGSGRYTVFVENGSGSGYFYPGENVIITANTPAEGMRFDKWTTESPGVTIPSVSIPAAVFTMPANNVTIKANFVAATTPAATGTGSGNGTTTRDDGNTRVDIEKPGISNRDLATANVNGSTDNFIVKISETDEATRAVAAALTNKYGTLDNILYYAMDISLYDSTGTTKISDTTGLTVDITIPIPDSLVAYGGNNMAGAVVSGDQLESLNENFTTINGVPCIRFRATHFSPYTIYVDTGNLVEGMLDTTPKTGDPIHPKWFLSLGLACLSIILFMKKERKVAVKA